MALDYHRDTASRPYLPPFLITVLLVLAAFFLGTAMAYLVVPFEPAPGWSAFIGKMWF